MDEAAFLFISVDAPPKIGGVASLALNLSAALAAACPSPSVLIAPNGSEIPDGMHLELYEDLQSDPKRREGPYVAFEDDRIRELILRVAQGRRFRQIILWHPFYYGPAAVQASRILGIPCSVFVHGTEMTSQFPAAFTSTLIGVGDVSGSGLPARLAQTLQGANCIFTNSEFTGRIASSIAGPVPVRVVGAGIDADEFGAQCARSPAYSPEQRSERRIELGIPDRQTLACLGRLVPHKNQQAAIRLLPYLPDTQLLILGTGPDEARLRDLAASLNLTDRIVFAGSVSETEKWDYLHASDAGLLFSRFHPETGGYEGFGIAILEYIAAGCVPIATTSGGLEDLLTRDQIGLRICFEKQDVPEITSLMSDVLSRPEIVRDRLEYARRIVADKYLWSEVGTRMLQFMPEKIG